MGALIEKKNKISKIVQVCTKGDGRPDVVGPTKVCKEFFKN